jgi:hypothetical protein
MSDDHSAEAVGYRKHGRLAAFAHTAHLDKLALEGAAVEDMFVSLSLCSPSRASILTGVHAHGTLESPRLRQTEAGTLYSHSCLWFIHGAVLPPPRRRRREGSPSNAR